MPINKDLVSVELEHLRRVSPAGYFIGLHMRFTAPCYTYNTYGNAWRERYQARGYLLQDPILAWTYRKTGTTRWSDLAEDDPAGLMADAARHGMRYGAVISYQDNGSKSFGSFARNDAEFDDSALYFLSLAIEKLHKLTDIAQRLTEIDLRTIRAIASLPYSEAAKELGIAEVTVKHRISVIKQKLQATDGKDVVFLAREAQLI
jgi:LuxR family transcriptional regulator, quorum-sensing system regulator SdiA